MYIVYFGNILQIMILYSIVSRYCDSAVGDYEIDGSRLLFCHKYDLLFNVFVFMTVLSWIILILSTWNTIRCHRNFDKNVGFYCK